MKKTLVALAVAAVAASSANAAVVYDNNGSKVEVGGSLRVLLSKNSGERADLKNTGSRLIFKASQDLGNGFSALGNIEIRFDKNGDDSFGEIETKRLYAGFKQEDIGTLTFGRQLTNMDDLGLSDFTYDLGGINQTRTSANKSVKFRTVEWNGLSFGADYFFDQDATKGADNTRGWGAALFYNVDIAADANLAFSGGFSQSNVAAGSKTVDSNTVTYAAHKENAFIVSSKLTVGKVEFAVDYSQNKSTGNVNAITYRGFSDTAFFGAFNKVREIAAGARYQYADNASVYAHYIWGKAFDANNDHANCRFWIVGTDYKLAKNVVTYVEGGSRKVKGDEKVINNYAGVGLRVFF